MWPLIVSFGFVSIRTFWLFAIIAFLSTAFSWWKKIREEHYDEMEAFDGLLVALLAGVFFGRALFIATHFSLFGWQPISWFALMTSPGISLAGSILGSSYFIIRTAQKKKWDVFEMLDFWSLAVSIGAFWLHIGYFFDSAGVGLPTSLPWGIRAEGSVEMRHPVALYSALVFMFLYQYLSWVEYRYRRFTWYRNKRHSAQTGFLTACWLLVVGSSMAAFSFVSQPILVVGTTAYDSLVYLGVFVCGLVLLLQRPGRLQIGKR